MVSIGPSGELDADACFEGLEFNSVPESSVVPLGLTISEQNLNNFM